MTKIAISPNVNGTGTFTLAAPNSNTDRTLTLPDAGGEVFSQGNIVGTVSQSGGVPTGAIIERGSNANGEYVRFADGTQICVSFNTTFNRETDNTLLGVVSQPAAFTGNITHSYSVSTNLGVQSPAGIDRRLGVLRHAASDATNLRITRVDGSSTAFAAGNNIQNVRVTSIGRWF